MVAFAAGCAADPDAEESGAAISGMPSVNLEEAEARRAQAPFRIATKEVVLKRYAADGSYAFEPVAPLPPNADRAFHWKLFQYADERVQWRRAARIGGVQEYVLVTEEGTDLAFWLVPIQTNEAPRPLLRCSGVGPSTGPDPSRCY